jgi:putative acetyltransferase
MTQEPTIGEIVITPFTGQHTAAIIQLITHIQQQEFHIAVTAADQPDLTTIPSFYQSNNGNFWLALQNEEVVGTIGLVDAGDGIGALRKMFVKKAFRGKELGLGKKLLDTLLEWARDKGFTDIYLGTVEVLEAAQRFYEKNDFTRVAKVDLPANFPVMQVDTIFYRKEL